MQGVCVCVQKLVSVMNSGGGALIVGRQHHL